jgi:hypothetical protein
MSVTISPVIVINIQVIPIQSRLNLNCCMWLNVSVPSESLWKGVTSVSNAGKKRGRGKGVGKKMAKDLNRGQVIGVGEYGFWWQKARNTVVSHVSDTGFWLRSVRHTQVFKNWFCTVLSLSVPVFTNQWYAYPRGYAVGTEGVHWSFYLYHILNCLLYL